jgi:transcriptional regulator with XRE-family HTH domain
MNLGKGIKLLLDQKGISQKELAEKIGKSETSVSLIMKNHTQPRKETVEAIAKVLDIKPEVLLLLSIDKEDLPDSTKDRYEFLWPIVEKSVLDLFLEKK